MKKVPPQQSNTTTRPMENHLPRTEGKLPMIMKYAPMGMAEIDDSGEIIYVNAKAEAQLKPVKVAKDINGNNLIVILETIVPSITEKIRSTPADAGHIIINELHSFSLSFAGEQIERHFNFTVIKMDTDCTIVYFDDVTQRRQKERAIQSLVSEKAVMQGKFEIASNILHDIGNGVVGFGSYVGRIRRALDQNNAENLQKLADFFATQQAAITPVFGEAKAAALVNMLAKITEAQKNIQEEIRKSVGEQQNIITHIQDILNIQRQYVNGNEALEKKPTNLRSIITDCMSMLYASIEKRKITVSIKVPDVLPVISADRTRLMQVILNILKNGIEAIDLNAAEKSISLSVSTYDGQMILEIADTGHGFDEATGKQLFERGFTTKASGSGIGLHNCRAIIESHDGTIEITSEGFGKGATTIIKFKI
jgi:signal transduction histidine kinase